MWNVADGYELCVLDFKSLDIFLDVTESDGGTRAFNLFFFTGTTAGS